MWKWAIFGQTLAFQDSAGPRELFLFSKVKPALKGRLDDVKESATEQLRNCERRLEEMLPPVEVKASSKRRKLWDDT